MDTKRVCRFCGTDKKLSREHAVSRGVLALLLGQQPGPGKLKNVMYRAGHVSGARWLQNDEPVIRDVCGQCNGALGDYDSAGTALVSEVIGSPSPTTVRFPPLALGWLVKTHLNLIHGVPAREGLRPVALDRRIPQALISHEPVPPSLYRLFVEGLDVPDWLWGDQYVGVPQPWTRVAGLEDQKTGTRLLVSLMSIRWLNTLFIVPANADYSNFRKVSDALLDELAGKSFRWSEVDPVAAVEAGQLSLSTTAGIDEILPRLRFVNRPKTFAHRVIAVEPMPEYRLSISFDDGVSGVVDISRLLIIFPEWRDREVFESVTLDADSGPLVWPNGVQIALAPFYEELSRSGRS